MMFGPTDLLLFNEEIVNITSSGVTGLKKNELAKLCFKYDAKSVLPLLIVFSVSFPMLLKNLLKVFATSSGESISFLSTDDRIELSI